MTPDQVLKLADSLDGCDGDFSSIKAALLAFAELQQASKMLVTRWHEPTWKDVPATAQFIHHVEQALARLEAIKP